MLRMQTLGGLAVLAEGKPLRGNAQQPRRLAVLALLARAGSGGINRDRIAALLWADVEEERARRSLNQALYALRQELGSEDAILGTRDLRLNPELIEVDLAEFDSARRSGAMEQAARLYTGPFLGDFHLPGTAEFDRWAEAERASIAADYRAVLESVAASAAERNDRAGAVFWWRRLASLDPADAGAAQGLMRALALAGDAPAALRHAEIFDQIRQQELELPPDPEVRALAERIRREAATRPIPPPSPLLSVPRAPEVATVAPTSPPVSPPEPSSRSLPRPRVPGRWRVGVAVVAVLALWLGWRLIRQSHPGDGQRRLAVLPFENEGDSSDAYFADGMADDLRGKLAAIPGLEVVGSQSSNAYRGSTKRLPEIASDLGVRYLLVGKVRWLRGPAGVSRVSVSPELLRITAGGPPTIEWQQPFDAALTDVFQVQADIAGRVASALDLVLADSARRDLSRKPTESLAAYDEYLKGEAAAQDMKGDQAALHRAVAFYQRAVSIDSGFALAWCQLSRALTSLYSNGIPDPALGAAARLAAERARALRPREPRTYLALGDYYGSVNPVDNQRAIAEYEAGLRLAPNNVDLLSAAVATETSMGRWEEAPERLARASLLDPRSVAAARREATVNLFLRRYEAADSAADRAALLAPASTSIISLRVLIAVARGDLAQARQIVRDGTRVVDQERLLPFFAYYQDLYWVLTGEQQQLVLAAPQGAFDNDRAGWAMVRTELYRLRGDTRLTRAYADSARLAFITQTENAPDDGQRRVLLGLALAYLGQKAEAEREGRRGLELMPVSRDGYFGPYVQLQMVRIYILNGELEHALDQLEPLLRIPFYLSPGWLRIDPTFDPLRKHPRFAKLVQQ